MTVNKWEIQLGTNGMISRVKLNGTDIGDMTSSVVIKSSADGPTTVIVVYIRNEIVYVRNEVDLEADEETQ